MRFGFVPMLHTGSGRAFMLPYSAVPYALARSIDTDESLPAKCPHGHAHGLSVTEVPLTDALMSALGALLAEVEAHGRPEPHTAAPGARRPAD